MKDTKDELIESLCQTSELRKSIIELLEQKIELLQASHQASHLVAQPMLEMKPVNRWVI